jgi:hypothetical protein
VSSTKPVFFYGKELLAPRPTPKLEDHPSSAIRGCLFNLFKATLHIRGRSSIHNQRKRHAMVTGTHLTRPCRGYRQKNVSRMVHMTTHDSFRSAHILFSCSNLLRKKWFLCLIQWHVLLVQFHVFSTSRMDGDEWLFHAPAALTSG